MTGEAFESMSIDEIQARLHNLNNDRAALERALEYRRQQTRKDLAQEVREMILSRGHDLSDILDLAGSKKRGAGRGVRQARSYARYVDPTNPENSYVRGVLPGWMKEQMVARGLNPKLKADRETFKEQYLEKKEEG